MAGELHADPVHECTPALNTHSQSHIFDKLYMWQFRKYTKAENQSKTTQNLINHLAKEIEKKGPTSISGLWSEKVVKDACC